MRALAVTLVVVEHSGLPLHGGFIGVDVFFAISGFVIGGQLLASLNSDRLSLRDFYVRRFWRLFPALSLLVTFTVLASALVLSPLGTQQAAALTGLGAMTATANFVIAWTTGDYFSSFASMNPLLHTWSLSVEEQFYLVIPSVMAFAWFVGRASRHSRILAAAALTTLLIASFAWSLNPAAGFYSPIGRAWEFLAGMLVALLIHSIGRGLPAGFRIPGIALILGAAISFGPETKFPGPWTLVPITGACLILGSLGSHGIIYRLLTIAPVVTVGNASYSIYLWHWPFIVFAVALAPNLQGAALIGALVSLLPAALAYRWVEGPLRHTPGRRILLAGGIVGVPLLLSLILFVASHAGFWSDSVRTMQLRKEPNLTETLGCTGGTPDTIPAPSSCVVNRGSAGRPIALIGDSYAGQLGEAINVAAKRLGRPATLFTYGGCPVTFSPMQSDREYREGCAEYQNAVGRWLASAPASTIVLSQAEFYLRDPTISLAGDDAATTQVEKITRYEASLSSWIKKATGMGHDVLVVQSTPNFSLNDWAASETRWSAVRDCPAIRLVIGGCASSAPDSLATIRARQDPAWAATSRATLAANATLLDLLPSICNSDGCPLQEGTTSVYRDYSHITPQKSRALGPTLAEALSSAEQGQ